MAKRETKAKRERDGWRVDVDRAKWFRIWRGEGEWCACFERDGGVVVKSSTICPPLTPARAAQFAAKVAEIAARAAKEAKDGR